tara:strand:+ start:421 stop:624 length:204 start_codon:yes stop_codon:yes gene_type:complete
MCKYPNVHLKLDLEGPDGNAFMVLGHSKKIMQEADVPEEEIKTMCADAMMGTYEHLLQTIRTYIKLN